MLCVTAFALVGVRLVDVMLLNGQVSGSVPTAATNDALVTRADLVDRNGELLARDLPVHDLYAQPARAVEQRPGRAATRRRHRRRAKRRLDRMFAGKHNYVLVDRQLSPDVQAKVMRLGLPGLEFEPAYKRYYPKGSLRCR